MVQTQLSKESVLQELINSHEFSPLQEDEFTVSDYVSLSGVPFRTAYGRLQADVVKGILSKRIAKGPNNHRVIAYKRKET